MTSTLQKIPFVNGVPGTGQESISWIRNGDRLMGSSEPFGSDGNLNDSTAKVQENVVVVDSNTKALAQDVSKNEVDIQNIYTILNQGSNIDLIQRVSKNETDIIEVEQRLSQDELTTAELVSAVTNINERIGVKDAGDTTPRSLSEDTFFIRNRIGNKIGENINGEVDVSITEPTGIFKTVDDIINRVNENADDIEIIQQELSENDFPSLIQSVAKIRTELGPSPISIVPDVYTRLSEIDSHNNTVNTEISEIKNQIGSGNVDSDISKLKTDVVGIQTDLETVNLNIGTLADSINDPDTGLNKRVSDVESSNSNLNNIVSNPATGLQKQVANIDAEIGDVSDPSSINGKINAIQGLAQSNSFSIQDMQITVGDENSGLVQLTNYISTMIVNLSNTVNKGILFVTDATISTNTLTAINAFGQNLGSSGYSGARAPGGITSMLSTISSVPNLSTYNTIFLNCASYDYLFNTQIGTIADCRDDYSGSTTFFNEMYKLIKGIYSQPNGSRFKFILSTGYPTAAFNGSGVTWPSTNEAGGDLRAYSKAVKDFCDEFGFPCADTAGILGLNKFTITRHFDGNGLLNSSPLCAEILRAYNYAS